jgi:hypothetical protein
MRAVISYEPRRGLGSRLTLPENTFSSFAHAFHLRQHSSNSFFAASSDPARLSVRRFSGLPGKCSAQNQRSSSGPLRIS